MTYNYTEKDFQIQNGGKRISGTVLIPNRDEKIPCVILSHGYNSSADNLHENAVIFAKKGICSVIFDFCGGSNASKSSGTPLEMSIATEIFDLKSVIAQVILWDFINAEKVYLYGESQGGLVTAITASELKGNIKSIFLIFPALCIPDDWESEKSSDRDKYEVMGMTIGRKFVDELPEYDIYEKVSEYKGPVFIFHGKSDSLVPYSYSERADNVYSNSILTLFENEGHGFSKKVQLQVIDKIADFILTDGGDCRIIN